MNDIVTIRPFKEEDREELVANAKADDHSGVYWPTHVSIKHDAEGKEKIVGYLSIGVVPMVLTWQSREEVGPLDSLRILGMIEGQLGQYRNICIPCDPESPYNRLLPKAGYLEYTKLVKLYIKK